MTNPKLTNIKTAIDKHRTKLFYQTQNYVHQDCECSDCAYYETTFINTPIEIFNFLRSQGVNLAKNLESEPTGVWFGIDEKGKPLFCEQAFRLEGDFSDYSDTTFELKDIDYNTYVETKKIDDKSLIVYLSINQTE